MNRRGFAAAGATAVVAGFSSFAFFLRGPMRTRMTFASFILGLLFVPTHLLGQAGVAIPNWTVPPYTAQHSSGGITTMTDAIPPGTYFRGRGKFQNGAIVASSSISGAQSVSSGCPGVPALCGMTCSPDAFGTPIYCSNGQCSCAPGYDTESAPGGGLVCQPIQPEVIGTESDEYSCPGICSAAVPWATVGSIYKAFDLVPVHGIAPGGEAFMPVWGYQANNCGNQGAATRCSGGNNKGNACNTSADCPGGACTTFGVCQGGSNAGGICLSRADCAGTCGPLTEGQCQGGTNDGLSCNATHPCPAPGTCIATGFCSGFGGTCQSDADCTGLCDPVGNSRCSTDGRTCTSDADCPSGACTPVRTWAGCAPDPFPFCFGLQDSDEGDFDFNNCESSEGCGSCDDVDTTQWASSRSGNPGDLCGKCVSDFTDAWPYIDNSTTCSVGTSLGIDHGVSDPARIDFPNNVIVYRAPTRWEDFSDFWDNPIDDDYTWDMESLGHELFDTDTEFEYHHGCPDVIHGRIHIEFSSDETVDNFTDDDWGAANQFWRALRCEADTNFCDIGPSDRTSATRCFVKSFVNPGLTCPTNEDVDADCSLHDPMTVAVGVPSLDCADDAYQGTDEIHPVLAMAIRIQEDPSQGPEKWAFFYRQNGDTGPCGNNSYSRCLSTFKLPLGIPVVPNSSVLTGADVHVDWHTWTTKTFGSPSSDISVAGNFDLTNGTVLTIHLPAKEDGVVGLVTVTPALDTTPPQITCPGNISKPVDLGKCTAVATFPPPTISDNCSVSAACSMPSGSAFPIGTTTDTCTATDQAGLTASCSFNVTVTAGNKCPHAQGYWKNHPSLWPVSSLTLGSVTYNKTQLLSILNNSTTGDASVILAREEIATLLSLANGSNPTPICGTIADANAALGTSTVPAKVGPKTILGQRMVGDANTLDSYNIGNLTPGCTP
jgi:hypothetical protein